MGNLRPYLYKNYSLKKVGIYNTNADIHLLITRIEKLIKNNKEKDLISINKKIVTHLLYRALQLVILLNLVIHIISIKIKKTLISKNF